MSYAAAIDQLSAMTPELFTQPGHIRRKFSINEIGILLAALGNPHHRFPSVLIAGTNGKGSTAATLASILTASGLRAGLYTSPHLTRPNERIRVNGAEISDDAFAALYFRVHDCAQRLVLDQKLAQLPSFFETLTAMAFLHFDEANIDIAVLEVGMGGRLDATNIVDPLLSIVTDISLDHTEWLGPTIAAIAREKAGILRAAGTLITLPQHPDANEVLGEIATELGVRAVSAVPYMPPTAPRSHTSVNSVGLVTGHDRGTHPVGGARAENALAREERTLAPAGISYSVQALGTVIEVASPLHGAHQQRNIALAIAAAVELAFHHGVPITPASITAGIRNTRWPARLERIVTYADEEPAATQLPTQWILDVAHNPAGAWALRAALRSLLDLDGPDAQPPTLIFSCLRDKPIAEMAQILFPTFDRVIFAPIRSPRATPVADMLEAAASTGTPATAASSVAEAIELAEIPAPAPPAANSAKNIAHAPSTDASTTASASFGTGHDRGTHPVGGSRAESASKEDGTLAPEESSATNSARMASTPPNLPDTSNWREARSAPRAVAPRVVVAGSVYLVGEARALLLARAGVPA